MADVYVVLLNRGNGEAVAAFSSVALAHDFVSNNPPCNMQICYLIIDNEVGETVHYYIAENGVNQVSNIVGVI